MDTRDTPEYGFQGSVHTTWYFDRKEGSVARKYCFLLQNFGPFDQMQGSFDRRKGFLTEETTLSVENRAFLVEHRIVL